MVSTVCENAYWKKMFLSLFEDYLKIIITTVLWIVEVVIFVMFWFHKYGQGESVYNLIENKYV